MREIHFRRCRLEIEPSGIVRLIKGEHRSQDMRPNTEMIDRAAEFGYTSAQALHIAHKIAIAWLWDIFDEDFADDAAVGRLLRDEPEPDCGTFDIMNRFWFQRTLYGWPAINHGEALNAATFTSFLASAIKAERDADNPHTGRDTAVDGEAVSGGD